MKSPFNFLRISFLLLALLNAGCSGGNNPDKLPVVASEKLATISNVEFEILAASTDLNTSSSEISGSALLMARTALPEVKMGRYFALRGKIPNDGSIRLISFANRDGTALKNGFEIEFARVSTESKLKVTAIAGNSTDDWSAFFATLDANSEFEIGFDIHNDENGEAHVVAWNLKNADPSAEPIFDSAKDVNGAPGKGFGRFWGVRIDSASVRSVSVGEVRDGH